MSLSGERFRLYITYLLFFIFGALVCYYVNLSYNPSLKPLRLGSEDIEITEFFEYCGKEIMIFKRMKTNKEYLCIMDGEKVDLIDVTDEEKVDKGIE